MEIHKLLSRQLSRLGLNDGACPLELKKWQELLAKVNLSYTESDQERYLNERSIEISSKELQGLNNKLEEAQHIAKMGYWDYDSQLDKIFFSKELYNLFQLDPKVPAINIEKLLKKVHKQDRACLQEIFQRSLSEKNNQECEIRILMTEGNYLWCYFATHAMNNQLSGIAMDITKRKRSEEEIKSLNKKLISSAREVGMSDVATSVLHNVGNILNSANVSVNLLQEKISEPYYKNLFTAMDMVKDNLSSIARYLSEDPKGKIIPP